MERSDLELETTTAAMPCACGLLLIYGIGVFRRVEYDNTTLCKFICDPQSVRYAQHMAPYEDNPLYLFDGDIDVSAWPPWHSEYMGWKEGLLYLHNNLMLMIMVMW